MQASAKDKSVAITLALVGAILFSSKAVMVKLMYGFEVDKLTLMLLRMGFALPIYLVIAFKDKQESSPVNRKDWVGLIFLGVIGYYFASFLDFWGLEYITASLERLVLFIYPTITTIFAAIYFKRKINKAKIIAIVLSYVGITIAFWDKIQQDTHEDFWLGAFLIFLSAVTFSIYLVGSENLIPKFGAKKFTSYCMITSCVSVLIHFGATSDVDVFAFPWEVYALGLFIAVFNTVLPSYMMSAAIKTIGASSTSILSSVGPISVIVLGYFLLDEDISIYQLIGTAIVIGGVLMISVRRK